MAHHDEQVRLEFSVAIGGAADINGRAAEPETGANDPKTVSESCPKLRGELLGRRTFANEKMVNRVGRHKCGVTLWQM
jgi:hypothetical protein